MKIIKPSYEILNRCELSLEEKIEHCGRVAYKSEDKVAPESAKPFVDKIINSGHFPVIEFACIHLHVKCNNKEFIDFYKNGKYKYLSITTVDDGFIISGTVRAFKEAITNRTVVGECIGSVLYDISFLFMEFKQFRKSNWIKIEEIPVDDIIGILSTQETLKHIMVAVKFIHNRAFTHELVRMRPCSFIQESQRYCRYSNDKFGNEVTFIHPGVFFNEGAEDQEMSEEWLLWKDAMMFSEKTYLSLLDMGYSPQAARTVLPNSCKTEIIVYTTLEEWKHIFDLRCSTAAEPSMRELMVPLRKEFWQKTECWE